MTTSTGTHLFIIGTDYHLGDLLWLTAVLAEYRRQCRPDRLILASPDGNIHRILEGTPPIDCLLFGNTDHAADSVHVAENGPLTVHDLRPLPIARAMMRSWRRYLPWLYYRDMWLQPRGQWLATFLGLGPMRSYRPVIDLTDGDREVAQTLPSPYVALAPHIGEYTLPFATPFWRRVKGWPTGSWQELARRLRRDGYEPVSLGASGQPAVPGTRALTGLPIRQVAGIIEGAAGIVTGESGLWFLAAATETPFIIVPWWLPRGIDWAAPMGIPHCLVRRSDANVETVARSLDEMLCAGEPPELDVQ